MSALLLLFYGVLSPKLVARQGAIVRSGIEASAIGYLNYLIETIRFETIGYVASSSTRAVQLFKYHQVLSLLVQRTQS